MILIYSSFRQLTEIRASEALTKEKIRRDYERLRIELDEITKQEQEAKDAAGIASFAMFQQTILNNCFIFSELSKHSINSASEARSSSQGPNE